MLNVLYQDNHLLVVEKPAGVLSQSDTPNGTDDLLNQAKAYIKREFQKPGAVWLGLVHRLDREVGGVMIFARTSKAAARLSEEIRAGRTRKVYRAWLEREPRLRPGDRKSQAGAGDSWILLEDHVAKDAKRRMAIRGQDPDRRSKQQPGGDPGKIARLRYRTIGRSKTRTGPVLVEIELETGRFHQIRFQFADRGAPILGDRKYGARNSLPGVRLALYCVEMGVRHPVRGDFLSFRCEPPAEWSAAT